MTQASQALPSWLTLSSTVITEADGSLSTSFATLTLPLTYYGPPIPLGTDGTWVYGGLSSPAPTTAPSTTPTPSSSATPSSIPPSTSSPSASPTTSAEPSSISTSTSSPLPSSSASAVPPVAASHGLSKAALGGLIGGIVGALLLLIMLFTLCILLRNRRRHGRLGSAEGTSSSFYNRQTTLVTSADPNSTPIWTGWDLISAGEAEDGNRTPGEGSPRHSGEEGDPFLTRRRSGATLAEEMTQTKTGTETLVSLPAAAVVGAATTRSSPPRTGNIIPRDVINRMMDEDYDEPPAGIRIVEASPQADHSPLLPPPLLNPDALGAVGMRSSRNVSQRSLHSPHRSLGSQKSMGSLEDAELRVARRVRLSELDPEAGPSRNGLGLQNLSGRIGRLSWFRRMSLTRSSAQPATPDSGVDSYTRSPTRSTHSRHASRSRPSSYVRFQEDSLATRPPRTESGLGYNTAGSRPISSVSAKSTSAASGNTAYYDAVSTPTSEIPEVPEIPERFQARGGEGSHGGNGGSGSSGNNGGTNSGSGHLADNSGSGSQGGNVSSSQQSLAQVPGEPTRFMMHALYVGIPNEPPPSYDEDSLPRHRAHTRLPSNIDVLDIPAPPPVSYLAINRAASASASSFPPPGLVPIPPIWRDSHPSNQASSPTGSADIAIDIEDEPPAAAFGWRNLTATGHPPSTGRRTTFGTVGTPMVINPPVSPTSEIGSLHSMRSHLSPYASRSPVGSAPASIHQLSGSGSSRPSAHSHARTNSGSLAHSSSISSMEQQSGARRAATGNLVSPPLSAVFPRARSPADDNRATSPAMSPRTRRSLFPPPGAHDVSPTSSRTPLLTADGTVNSQTNSSITTTMTDPVTGAVMHLPGMPWRTGTDPHGDDARWNTRGPADEDWS